MQSGQSWPGKDEDIVIPVLARAEKDGIRTVLARKRALSYTNPDQEKRGELCQSRPEQRGMESRQSWTG
jgi:hypothetical protein